VRLDLATRSERSAQLDLHVEDGSVVMVREKPEHTVSVIGLVRRPNNYPYPVDERLRVLDAVALAGGLSVSVADKTRVIRQVPDREEPLVIEVSIRKAKREGAENLVLAPGDTVVVEETPATFVVETIRGFIRFGFTSAIPGI
jgi:polysaccharide export outer membrane protein